MQMNQNFANQQSKRLGIRVGGIQKTTLVDYPGKVAATIFTVGCNFSCAYCHNPELVCKKRKANFISEVDIFSFLNKRIGKLDAICISGGEPTLQKDLISFIRKIKEMGFLVKLDTNGTRPDILEKLSYDRLIDYIAMDIKSPLEKYSIFSKGSVPIEKIIQSIKFIINSTINYEFRTTVAKPLIFKEDFEKIGQLINGAKRFFIQNYVQASKQLDNFLRLTSFEYEELLIAQRLIKKYVKNVLIR